VSRWTADLVAADRLCCGSAADGSRKQKVLLSILKMRHMDLPAFVDVATTDVGPHLAVPSSSSCAAASSTASSLAASPARIAALRAR